MIACALAFPIPVWPRAGSSMASQVDRLFLLELSISFAMTLLIFGTIFVFAIKYRRRSPDERPRPIRGSMALETLWTGIPLVLFMGFFFWGARIFYANSDPPKDALQIYVVGKQWMWYVQHPEGQREINALHVPVGRPVQLILTSQDVIHSFFLPEFRIKKDAVPGMYTTEWFRATKTGSYHLFCAQYCGTNHSHMIGTLYVMKGAEYAQWLGGGRGESMAQAGAQLYQRLGCANCHGVICPNLNGLYMKGVGLTDGRVVRADEAYLRESILDPGAKIVAGFPNIMPSFRGQVTEVGILELIAYIKSLGSAAMAGPGEGAGAGQGMGTATGIGAPSEREQQSLQNMAPPSPNPHSVQSDRSSEVQPRVGGEVEDTK
jgi:cytochrome c oxidase subunit II